MTNRAITEQFHVEDVLALGGIDRVSRVTAAVLQSYGVTRPLFTEAEVEQMRWEEQVRINGMVFHFDTGKSVAANLADIFAQSAEIQKNSGGANFVGAMLQHLVGAKLDIVLGPGVAAHHGFSVADHSTERQGDFEVNGVTIHVTTHPTEALIRKAAKNLQGGLKPVIITLADGVEGAAYLLKNTEWKDRIDVIDATQFLTANVYERSLFKAGDCKATLISILTRYNEIVAECETDPVLQIRL
ncbi:MAG: DUF4928 family protein [Prosthecobacter sp.]|uniref:DUF4928 family protein n=1 Tax=Prosthecobacter sp. TaxID=1965333 RepID=UPI0038FD464F